jgi:hypothetical protein
MAELEKLQIWPDVKRILTAGQNPVRFEYSAEVHTVDKDFKVLKVITLDIVRDYVNWFSDYLLIEFILPLGDYVRDFYPYRTNLELTLTRRQLYETGTSPVKNSVPEVYRYKAVFMPDHPSFKCGEYDSIPQQRLNLLDTVTVTLQLLNRSLEPLRILTVGGVYKQVTMRKLIYSLLGARSQEVLVDGRPAVEGLDLVEPNNQKTYPQITIPQGTLLTSVPSYLQERSMGVYAGGMGSYLQPFAGKIYWFIYPLFDRTRFNTQTKKLIIYAVPKTRLYGVERTYRLEGNVVYLLATADKVYHDTAEAEYMTDGVGFKMTDAEAIMGKPVLMTEEGPVGNPAQLTYNVGIKQRDDGLNFAPVADRSISGNPFAQYAQVLKRSGARIDVEWQNANPDVLYPGMPCKYVFMEGTRLKEYYGVVLYNHLLLQMETPGMASMAHTATCQLTLCVWDPDDPLPGE